jgi:hypothetical protein
MSLRVWCVYLPITIPTSLLSLWCYRWYENEMTLGVNLLTTKIYTEKWKKKKKISGEGRQVFFSTWTEMKFLPAIVSILLKSDAKGRWILLRDEDNLKKLTNGYQKGGKRCDNIRKISWRIWWSIIYGVRSNFDLKIGCRF